jgi:hypothetical protein
MNEFEPAKNIDAAVMALDLKPLENPRDPRYVDCSKVRGSNVAKSIEKLLVCQREGDFLHLLFSGYRGNGKTTELFQLMDLIEEKYKTLYFDAPEELDLNNMTFPDLLLGIAKMISERMEKEGLPLPEELLKQVGEWFYERLMEKTEETRRELEVQAGIGTPTWFSFIMGRIIGTMKKSEDDRKIIRQKLNQDTAKLIEYLNDLLEAARKGTREKVKKDLLVIIDSLDRLKPGLETDLFMLNGNNFRRLKCHFIYVVPVSLFYAPDAPLLPFDDQLVMPMIPVRHRDGKENEDSINLLRKVLERRFDLEKVLTQPEETSREFILASGGHIRDLVRMLRSACVNSTDKIDIDAVRRRINELGESYVRTIMEDQYEYLIGTHKTKDLIINEATQKLIYHTQILVYQDPDGNEWKDVHPALVKSRKFQRLLSERRLKSK